MPTLDSPDWCNGETANLPQSPQFLPKFQLRFPVYPRQLEVMSRHPKKKGNSPAESCPDKMLNLFLRDLVPQLPAPKAGFGYQPASFG
jgi:hypothetical protein